MKETIKIALLAIIAVTLIVQTVGQRGGSDDGGSMASSAVASTKTKAANSIAEASDKPFDPLANKSAEPVDNTPKTVMSFASMEHDFGTIMQDSENKHVFQFTNTGKEPLIIESAKGSCGCTVPNYPKEPIPPGGTGTIEVEYKPGKQENLQNKTVTVVANTEPKQTTLRIKANVQKVG